MKHFFKAHTLIAGTVLLTASGFASRVLGFFYRIFLSRTIGAEGLGLYQILFPVFGICFSLCAGSVQTAISRFTAARPQQAKRILLAGFLMSFSMSLCLAAIIRHFAVPISTFLLMEPECAPLLPTLALAIPCTSVHACFCGYFYGKERVQVPALSQLAEQCIRIAFVFLFAGFCKRHGIPLTVRLAVLGLLAGEAGSALFTASAWLLFFRKEKGGTSEPASGFFSETAAPLLALSLPLMANRLILNLLQSAESVLIPEKLVESGLTKAQALGGYGVLTGMALPFILFPSAIVNSLAVVLLPTVARHQAAKSPEKISQNIAVSFRYSLYMGILCVGIFTLFGPSLGEEVFQSKEAGTFLTVLAWLCPFLYLATTSASILNGLGKTRLTFLHSAVSLLLRLAFVYFGIPVFGIRACLWGMLASELTLALLHVFALKRAVSFSFDAWESIVKPVFCLFVSLGIFQLFPKRIPWFSPFPPFFFTAFQIAVVCAGYGLMLLLFHHREKAGDGKG